MEKMVPALLTRLRLEHSTVEVSGTPRRLSVAIADLAQRQEDTCQRVRGPPKSKAFDSQGNPSKVGFCNRFPPNFSPCFSLSWLFFSEKTQKALEGFCRKNKVTTADISIVPDDKGVEYVYADVAQPGRVTWEVLSEELPAVISQLSFPRTMRWNSPVQICYYCFSFGHLVIGFLWFIPPCQVAYSRPIRWLLCLHGDHIVPFRYAGLYSGRSTRLLRNAPLPQAEVSVVFTWITLLRFWGDSISVVFTWVHILCFSSPCLLPKRLSPLFCSPDSLVHFRWIQQRNTCLLFQVEILSFLSKYILFYQLTFLLKFMSFFSSQDRKDKIWDASSALATSVGGKIPEECRGALLDEVPFLTPFFPLSIVHFPPFAPFSTLFLQFFLLSQILNSLCLWIRLQI